MKRITNKQYEEYQQFLKDKMQGKILTPEGLRLICEANECVPSKIGEAVLEVYYQMKRDNVFGE